ncbi:MAG: hypothetical protein RR364_01630 [Lachnospiraceae bacterium]
MTLYVLLHIVVIFLGGYTVFSAINMKKGKLAKWLTKGVTLTPESDIQGFGKKMFGMTIYIGIIVILYGVFGILTNIFLKNFQMSSVITVCFVILGLAYMVVLSSAKRKYLQLLG